MDTTSVQTGHAVTTSERRHVREHIISVVPGALLATVLTCWNYSSKPMWRDEWYTYSASERTLSQLVGLVSNIDGGLSFFYLLMHAWMSFGDSVAWMRVPAGVCTVVTTAVTALIGRRLGGRAVGVVSGLLVAVLPAVVDHAQEARAYPLVLAAVAGTALAMLRYLEKPNCLRVVTLSLLALVASVLHPIVGAPAIAGIFAGSLVAPCRVRRSNLVAIGLPAGLAAALLLVVGFIQVDVAGISSYRGYRTLLKLSTVLSPSFEEVGLMMVIVGLASAHLARRQRSELLVLLGWGISPIATIMVSAWAGSFSLARYASTSALAAGILIAYGVVLFFTTTTALLPIRRRQYLNLLLSVALLGVLMLPLSSDIVDARRQSYRVDDPRSGAQALSNEWRAGDAVVFVGPVYRGLTDFYAPPVFRPTDPLLISAPIDDDSFRGRELGVSAIADEVGAYKRVWLIGLLRQDKDYESEKKDAATEGRNLVERKDFGEFSLELWQ